MDGITPLLPGSRDPTLRASPTTRGKLTFTWDGGDLVFDGSGGYPVLMTILAHRGTYRADRAYGTLLYTVRKDRLATGSQLSAYVADGGAQLAAAGVATAVKGRAERVKPGRWRLRITWTALGQARAQELVY